MVLFVYRGSIGNGEEMKEEETFSPSGLGETIFKERYARNADETWEEACRRVATHIADAETNGKVNKYGEKFYEELVSNRFMPGGRIWYGSGRPKGQLLNCVSGDTLIHTSEGLIHAKELEGREVEVLSEGGVYRNAKWFSYGEQELFAITFENGDEVTATANHEWVVTKEKGGTERVTTRELMERNVPMQHIEFFDYDEDEWKAGVQHGLTYGDGSLYMQKKYAILPQFGDSTHLVPDYFDEYSYQAHAVVATKLPASYKEVPSLDESPSYLRGFIAGFIASDGCVDSRGHIMAHQANLDELISIRKIAASVGIPASSIKMARETNPWSGEYAPLWKISFLKQAFFTDGQYDKKMILKNKHREYMSQASSKKRFTQKVVSVRPTERVETVYCCNEPETNTFVIDAGYLTGNCFVIPVDDSREGWGKMLYDTTVISGLGGGIGANYSKPRPRGFAIKGTGGVSTGAVSAMKMQDGIANELRQGGGRRAALMQCLNINHPDLEEFLHVKLDRGELENANISVVLNLPTDEFVRLVQEDGDIIMEYNGLPTGQTLKAREVWDTLVKNAWDSGEPGVLNGHLANKMNNIWYYEELISTNPCGEIWLGAYDCCDLGSLVLPRFVNDGEFDWDMFDESIRLAVRFLDNVLDVNYFPLPEIQEKCHMNRRLGAGVMGLHTMLLKLGLRYDSEEGFEFVDRLFEFYKNTAYDASATLAAEKGPFPGFDRDKYLQGGFAKTLKRGIRNKIKSNGLRNCALMTIAPTGTTSMVAGVTSGIEPLFAPVYWRRYRISDEKGRDQKKQELVITEEYKEFGEIAVGAYDIPVRAHFEMQKTVQTHIDNAVSKTINLPKDYSLDNLSDIWLEYVGYCKGSTIYRQGSRGEEPLEHIPVAEAKAIIEAEGITVDANIAEINSMECVNGVCEVPTLNEVAEMTKTGVGA